MCMVRQGPIQPQLTLKGVTRLKSMAALKWVIVQCIMDGVFIGELHVFIFILRWRSRLSIRTSTQGNVLDQSRYAYVACFVADRAPLLMSDGHLRRPDNEDAQVCLT